jgi:predicted RNA-binding protein YlqC (UPF0109 family)
MADESIKCAECGKDFLFSESEQEFFKEKGFQKPKRCSDCRRNKKINIREIENKVIGMIEDLGFTFDDKNPDLGDFKVNSIKGDKVITIVVHCLSNEVAKNLLYNKGEEAGAIRTHIKAIGRKNNVFLNIDIKKPKTADETISSSK